METIAVERTVPAPIDAVFAWMSDASNYTESRWVVRERLIQPGEGAPYGLGAVRRLTWLFGLFRERVTEYHPPNEFHYIVERSVPPVRHEGGRLVFTETPEGTRVVWTTTVEMRVPVLAGAVTRLLGRPLIAYTFGKVLDAAGAAFADAAAS